MDWSAGGTMWLMRERRRVHAIEAEVFIDLSFCKVGFGVKSLEVGVLVSEIVYPAVPSLLVVLFTVCERVQRASLICFC